MATLFDALLHTARVLEALYVGVATGGSTTTIVDSDLPVVGFNSDDEWNQGTALLIDDPNGSVENISREIADYVQVSGTVTLAAPALSAPGVEAGDTYALIYKRYPRSVLVEKINEALQEYGEIVNVQDITSTGANEYALTSAFERILTIEHGDLAATEQEWQPITLYRHIEGRLWIRWAVKSGRTIRIRYYGQHPRILNDVDTINEDINFDWLGLAAALRAARWHLIQPGSDDRQTTALVNDLAVREAQARGMRRMWRPTPVTHIYPSAYPEE